MTGSSPHTRGAQRMPGSGFALAGIIPAYAGSTPAPTPSAAGAGDHPRIRGEHPYDEHCVSYRGGSSPHTRGAHPLPRPARLGRGIIPAYAGSTHTMNIASPIGGDHPRIRGEHADQVAKTRFGRGSSPHTRGAPARPGVPASPGRIIPAYAGSTQAMATSTTTTKDHPRIRGEHSRRRCCSDASAGSSPHTRGAPVTPKVEKLLPRIIPAYAGSTSSSRG